MRNARPPFPFIGKECDEGMSAAGGTMTDVMASADQEAQDHEKFRLKRAEKMGFGVDERWYIAIHREIDLHDLERLLEAGCPADLALRIVKPLE